MESPIEMSKTAQDALNRTIALRAITRETGTITKNTQSIMQLGAKDLSDVSLTLALAEGDALSGGARRHAPR